MTTASPSARHRFRTDVPFFVTFGGVCGLYVSLIVAMLVSVASFTTLDHVFDSLRRVEVRYSMWLSLWSASLSAIFSMWVAVPTGYLLSRNRLPLPRVIESILDIPIVLPPLVIGLCLLVFFQTAVGRALEGVFAEATRGLLGRRIGITYEVPAVVLSQFVVACAFAVRTMWVVFDQIDPRAEQVALTLGCGRSQAFWNIVFPQARRGLLAAGTLAFARSLGEFGPILVFAGATRLKTEVLPTTVFLELTVGNIEGAVAASLVLVVLGIAVLLMSRGLGLASQSL